MFSANFSCIMTYAIIILNILSSQVIWDVQTWAKLNSFVYFHNVTLYNRHSEPNQSSQNIVILVSNYLML